MEGSTNAASLRGYTIVPININALQKCHGWYVKTAAQVTPKSTAHTVSYTMTETANYIDTAAQVTPKSTAHTVSYTMTETANYIDTAAQVTPKSTENN